MSCRRALVLWSIVIALVVTTAQVTSFDADAPVDLAAAELVARRSTTKTTRTSKTSTTTTTVAPTTTTVAPTTTTTVATTTTTTAPPSPPPPPPANVAGLWTSAAELAAKPMSGAAWDRLKKVADGSLGVANIADQDSNHDVNTLAAALAFARTGNAVYRDKVVQALNAVVGTDENPDPNCGFTPSKARSMAVGRNLAGYVIAADLINFRPGTLEGFRFATWVNMVRFKDNCPNTGSGVWPSGKWFDLSETHDASGSNGSSLAGGARIAAALYLGDTAEVQRAYATFRRFAGDATAGAPLSTNDAGVTWSADPAAGVGVNRAGATKDGHRIDGAIPNDQGRGGSFTWLPGFTGYPWEGLQGFYVQALLLQRAGYPAFEIQDRAALRALDYMHHLWQQTGNVEWWNKADWVKYLANTVYGTQYPINGAANMGRNMAWTDWSHA